MARKNSKVRNDKRDNTSNELVDVFFDTVTGDIVYVWEDGTVTNA